MSTEKDSDYETYEPTSIRSDEYETPYKWDDTISESEVGSQMPWKFPSGNHYPRIKCFFSNYVITNTMHMAVIMQNIKNILVVADK